MWARWDASTYTGIKALVDKPSRQENYLGLLDLLLQNTKYSPMTVQYLNYDCKIKPYEFQKRLSVERLLVTFYTKKNVAPLGNWHYCIHI
jgi:hypothetical protein